MTRTLSVSLPSSTIYVSGTVNGVATTWTNTEGNTWESIAARSADDKYLVELTIIDSNGQSATSSITLYYGLLNLITDRTKADVDRVKRMAAKGWPNMTEAEKAEWAGELKGAYNASDLNRVESAVAYLAGILAELPEELKAYAEQRGVHWDSFFNVPYDPAAYGVTVKTDWVMADIPTPSDMARYLANVVLLRNALNYATDDLPVGMDNLTHDGANAIERALRGLDEAITALREATERYIDNTAAVWFYSGEIYAGEVTA